MIDQPQQLSYNLSMRPTFFFLVTLVVMVIPVSIAAHSSDDGAVIHMTDRGFEPSEVTIESGQAVIFENLDTTTRWPASDVHPTHTAYPGSDIRKCDTEDSTSIFDACQGLESGESRMFVFEEEGEWYFHDHLNPHITGTVQVVASLDELGEAPERATERGFFSRLMDRISSFFSGIVSSLKFRDANSELSATKLVEKIEMCLEKGGKDIEVCYDNLMAAYLTKNAPKDLLRAFDMAMLESENVRRDCHQITHAIGREALPVMESIADVFDLDREVQTCAGGLYHGAIEKLFRPEDDVPAGQHISQKEFEEKIPELCAGFDSQLVRGECVHGIGHGALYVVYEMQKALNVCDILPEGNDHFGCYSGVFMEYSLSGRAEEDNANDAHYPCNTMSKPYRNPCYYVQTFRLKELDFSDAEIVKICRESENPAGAFCVRGHGIFTLAHEALAGKENSVIAFCESLDLTNKRVCAESVASRLASYSRSGEQSMPFCSKFDSPYVRERCFGYAADVLRVGYEKSKEFISLNCRKYLVDPEECLEAI